MSGQRFETFRNANKGSSTPRSHWHTGAPKPRGVNHLRELTGHLINTGESVEEHVLYLTQPTPHEHARSRTPFWRAVRVVGPGTPRMHSQTPRRAFSSGCDRVAHVYFLRHHSCLCGTVRKLVVMAPVFQREGEDGTA